MDLLFHILHAIASLAFYLNGARLRSKVPAQWAVAVP